MEERAIRLGVCPHCGGMHHLKNGRLVYHYRRTYRGLVKCEGTNQPAPVAQERTVTYVTQKENRR